jgi:hypothetical protein
MSQPAVPSQPLDEPVPRVAALSHESPRVVFAQTMGLVAVTVGTAALGAYLGRNLGGGVGIALFVGALACVVGLNVATERHARQSRQPPPTQAQRRRRTLVHQRLQRRLPTDLSRGA